MTEEQLDPARTVIAKAGGVEAVVAVTGKHISRVYRWMRSKEKGGTGGIIPPGSANAILQHAQKTGLPISASDFFTPSQEERASA